MTLSMPLGRVRLPTVLNGQQNGKVDPALLTWVESAHTALVWLMADLPARAMRAWHAEALKNGIVLTSTGRGRTYDQQVALFLSRYTTSTLTGRPTKVWGSVTYWQKPNTAMAAVPGTSNHGWWCADDLAEIVAGSLVGLRAATVQWLYATGAAFGFTWETTSEVWHVDWACGDTLPQAVIIFEAPAPNPQPQPQPPQEDDMAIGIIELTDAGAQFIGECTPAGGFLEVRWIATTKDIGVANVHRVNGARVFTYPMSVMRTVYVDRLPQGDRVAWTFDDVANDPA